MNRVVHFEIQADNPQRAVRFYTEVFGWSIERMGEQDYWMIRTAGKNSKEPGINGGLLPRSAKAPRKEHGTNAYVCTIEVEDFDKIAYEIEAAGGLNVVPKSALPGGGWQGYFLDTEGNTFGIHQSDERTRWQQEFGQL